MWSSKLLPKITISSKKDTTVSQDKPLKTNHNALQNVSCAFNKQNGIRFHTNCPYLVTNAVLSWSLTLHLDLVIPIGHIQRREIFTSCQSINTFTYFRQWVLSLTVTSLTFLRSIQYLTVPSLFRTNTVGDAHSEVPLEIIPASKSI